MAHIVYKILDLVFVNSQNIHVAAGIVVGLHLGLISMFTIQWIAVFFFLLIFRINLTSTFITYLFCEVASSFLMPQFDSLGAKILTGTPSLYPYWGWMQHLPLVPFTDFHHTDVMGATLIAYLLTIPLFLISMFLAKYVRLYFSRIWHSTKISRTYAHYARTRN